LDLAVAGLSNGVSVLLGNGDGTFQKPLTVAASNPADLVAADLDGDGNMDLVVVESGGTGNGALDVFLGDGTGHFRKKACILRVWNRLGSRRRTLTETSTQISRRRIRET
jgi:hypothetical protein